LKVKKKIIYYYEEEDEDEDDDDSYGMIKYLFINIYLTLSQLLASSLELAPAP
jgi:hypothetical protein